MSQPTRWARTPRIKMTPLGGDEIIVRIYWKYNFRSILTSKGSAEPPAEFSQSTEVPDFHWSLRILNAQMQIISKVLNSKKLSYRVTEVSFFLSLIPHWRETLWVSTWASGSPLMRVQKLHSLTPSKSNCLNCFLWAFLVCSVCISSCGTCLPDYSN